MEAIEEFMGPQDHTHIVKGKRTKRQRPQSPIPFTIATDSSTGDGGGSGGYGSNGDNINNNIDHNSNSSRDTSAEFMDSTEEEEDMANCLILLAQGHSRDQSQKPNDHEDMETGTYKFNSKRYIETPSNGNGKVGMYVYQCKTCSRTFSSFQALGGHRASHKKPKLAAAAMADDYQKKPFAAALSDDEELHYKNLHKSSSLTDLQLNNRAFYSNNGKTKIHECSICGAEFSSGQALGGHMRRHRGPAAANTTLSLSPIALEIEEAKKRKNGLSLDLNLPAPEDDHHRESKFSLASQQQQQQQQQSALELRPRHGNVGGNGYSGEDTAGCGDMVMTKIGGGS
ncbi:hypothetical protein F0562_025935 [Nyssa sinensis]|uniref:C2H2-type domain-containing protein n=1 Tax=Nyssa sinensis TaxID=561372 RepID=A0A5J5B7N1_9ASTE|nr:hypothetical protein F0562_025935 [Nyssa sinensis]